MYYSNETEAKIEEILSKSIFSPILERDIFSVLSLRNKFSPLSDIRSILKIDKVQFEHLLFSADSSERFPLRNIVRLICKISNVEFVNHIKRIFFKEMRLGCDFFEGKMIIDTDDQEFLVNFEWCWTDFNKGIGFDRFAKFEITKI